MSSAERRPTLEHLPALDGLRGVAVVGVLFFHDGHLRGGYLGVDLFFVLSGFLITSLLLREHQATGKVDFAQFWVRRARRLFPALFATLAAVAAYAAALAEKTELARIRGDGFATLAYVANWRAIFAKRSYWEMFAAPSPLEHTWSLSIEEQFYVVWPIVAFVVIRWFRGSPRVLLGVSLSLAALSMASMWLRFDPIETERAYLGTDTRSAAILLGAALACGMAVRGKLASDRAVRALDLVGLVAALGLAVAWVRLDGTSPFLYHGGFWLTELAVLALIACAAHSNRSLVARAFAFRPLAAIGLISYGLYLWHWPIFVIVRTERVGFDGWRLSVLRFALTFAVSYVSYRFLERPIRMRGVPFGRPIIVAPAAGAAVALTLVCCTRGAQAVQPVVELAPPPPPPTSPTARDRHLLPPVSPGEKEVLRLLVVGDSVAQSLGERMYSLEDRRLAVTAERGVGDCSIMEGRIPARSLTNGPHAGGNCAEHWKTDVAELHPDVTLVILGGGIFARLEVKGTWMHFCEPPARRAYSEELVSRLESLGPDAGRIVIARVPNPVAGWKKDIWDQQIVCFNETMSEVAEKVNAKTIDLHDHVCPGGHCALENDGAPIRPDGMHFGGKGAEETADWVLSELGAARRPEPPPPASASPAAPSSSSH